MPQGSKADHRGSLRSSVCRSWTGRGWSTPCPCVETQCRSLRCRNPM